MHLLCESRIQYDYNQDKKNDFIFLERDKETANVVACFSDKASYRRQSTDIAIYLEGSSTNGEDYHIFQEGDKLAIHINYFAHNEGSAYRSLAYEYDIIKSRFKIIDNQAETNPVFYDGEPYPMGAASSPTMNPPK